KRGSADLVTIQLKGWQSSQAMGERKIDASFTLFEPVDFQKGDWVTVYGQRYELNVMPTFTKKGERLFEYSIQFEHESYRMREIAMLGYDADNQLTEKVHTLRADAAGHMALLLANLNRVSSGWALGAIDATDIEVMEYNAKDDNLLAVLNKLAAAFETEYWIEGKVIHLAKRTGSMNLTLGYGRGKGFTSVKKTNKNNAFIKTR